MLALRLAKLKRDRVRFGYSPGQEAIHSLHVLLNAKEHPLHIAWVLRARRQIGPALKAEIDAFRFMYAGAMPVLWDVRQSPELHGFADELAELRRRPAEPLVQTAAALAAGRPAQKGERWSTIAPTEEVLQAVAHHTPSALPLLRAAFDHPERFRDRYAAMLEQYWERCLAPEWPALEELFSSDIQRRGRTLYRKGVCEALARMSPNLRVESALESAFLGNPGKDRELVFGEDDQLFLMPSYFSWPHVFINTDPNCLLLTYPVVDQQYEAQAPIPPERLLKMLRAAGDATRLQILQLLGQRQRSTTELAGLIGISEAAVSRHLKQLQEAELVEPERQSYYVFYRLVRERLAEIGQGLESALTGD